MIQAIQSMESKGYNLGEYIVQECVKNITDNILSHEKYGAPVMCGLIPQYDSIRLFEAIEQLSSEQIEISDFFECIEIAYQYMWELAFSKPVDMQAYNDVVKGINAMRIKSFMPNAPPNIP